ncbi:uncharacterized protein LOC108915177 [Anoplophora glabripennis]|uniref:uncharacterized protein LOC108915177 n=1 Tax=Anoplophora glabripennis TaxID=217634 RepID=UPI000873AA90|nr:uncharacterized protein LOC108915177 [Anoplophora glabripennis]XP_018576663.1 uncharacterized protein LOC108915177 [Anoplophora glabripennis]
MPCWVVYNSKEVWHPKPIYTTRVRLLTKLVLSVRVVCSTVAQVEFLWSEKFYLGETESQAVHAPITRPGRVQGAKRRAAKCMASTKYSHFCHAYHAASSSEAGW